MTTRDWFDRLKELFGQEIDPTEEPTAGALRNAVTAAQSELDLTAEEAKALALVPTVKAASRKIDRLSQKGKAALAERKAAELAAISAGLTAAAEAHDKTVATAWARRLHMLNAELDTLLKPKSEAAAEKLRAARATWADTLLLQITEASQTDSSDAAGMTTVMTAWVEAQLQSGTDGDLAVVNKALTLWGKHEEAHVATASQAVSNNLATMMQEDLAALGPSTASRDEVDRTPSEVVVHLLSAVIKAMPEDNEAETLAELRETLQRSFAQRALTVDATHDLLSEAAQTLDEADFEDLAALAVKLGGQMPKRGQKVAPTRAHDNLYGRTYDSALVDALVQDPPEGTLKALGSAGSALADCLDGNEGTKKWAGEWVKKLLKEGDPRFWNGGVPALTQIKNCEDKEEAFNILKDFLSTEPEDGLAAVAFPWLLVKLSLKSQQFGVCPWMEPANKNYMSVTTKQAGRENELIPQHKAKGKVLTKGGGITLAHQPNAVQEEEFMVPSQRPTTVNRPMIRRPDDDPQSPSTTTPAIETALEHEAVYGSGVSGSTNIMLHLLKWMNTEGGDVDPKDFLVGTMMFLVYDGGHSIHEVMWTANQLDDTLGLDLDLDLEDSEDPNAFVGNTDRLVEILGEDTQQKVAAAQQAALDKVVSTFNEHSHFAESEEEGLQGEV